MNKFILKHAFMCVINIDYKKIKICNVHYRFTLQMMQTFKYHLVHCIKKHYVKTYFHMGSKKTHIKVTMY